MTGTHIRKVHLSDLNPYLPAFLLACVLALALPGNAWSHAELIESTPENGAQLAAPPTEIVLYFSEGVQTGEIGLLDETGNLVETGAPAITGEDRRTAAVALPPLDEGIYTVRWQMLAQDGHVTSSSFFFVIGEEMPTREAVLQFLDAHSGPSQLATQPIEPPARGLLFLALAGLIGIPITWLLVLVPAQKSTALALGAPANRFLARAIQLCGIAVCLGSTLLVGGQYTALHSGWNIHTGLSFLGETPGGQLALTRVAIGAGLVGAGFWMRKRNALLTTSIASGLLLTLSLNQSSHAASILPAPAVWVDLAHLLAAGFWAGGLTLLAWLVFTQPATTSAQTAHHAPPATDATSQPEQPTSQISAPDALQPLIAAATARFSILALATVTSAIASGLILTAWLVPNPQALWQTLYGTTLTIKLGLLAIAVGLGAVHRYFTLPRLIAPAATVYTNAVQTLPAPSHLHRFRWSLAVEVAAVVGILSLSGLLTSAPPAVITQTTGAETRTATGETPRALNATEPEQPIYGQLGVAPMEVQVTPFQVGLNVFDVTFVESQPKLENFTLLLRLPDQEIELPAFELAEIEPGLWSTVGALPVAGSWQARAAAFVDGSFQADRFEIALHSHHEHAHHEHGEHAHDEHEHADQEQPDQEQPEPEDRESDLPLSAQSLSAQEAQQTPEEPGDFARLLRLAAALIASAGTLIVAYDIRRFRRIQPE